MVGLFAQILLVGFVSTLLFYLFFLGDSLHEKPRSRLAVDIGILDLLFISAVKSD